MEIIIDFKNSGLTEKDFSGREKLEKRLMNSDWKDEIHIDRDTHSTAVEFFKMILQSEHLVVFKYVSGAF